MDNKITFQYILNCLFRYFMNACGITLILSVFASVSIPQDIVKGLIYAILIIQCFCRACIELINKMADIGLVDKIGLKLTQFHKDEIHSISIKGKAVEMPYKEPSEKEMQMYKSINICCIHEAGHAVMAKILGLTVLYAEVSSSYSHTSIEFKQRVQLTADDLEKYAEIYYAGAAAEQILTGKIHAGCVGAESADYNMAESYIRQSILISEKNTIKVAAGSEFEAILMERSEQLYMKAYQSISECKELVKAVSDRLFIKKKLPKEELDELILSFLVNWSNQGY